MSAPVAPRPLPAIHRAFPGIFYGWVVVLGSALVALVCVGIGFYSQAVLLDGLVTERGWSRSSVSAASSLYFLVGGITGNLIGRGVDRWGGRGWMIVGACIMALALVAVGRIGSVGQVFPVYTLMAVGFAMCTAVPNNAIITRWFISLRTRALSVSQTGVSLGGIVVVPLATWWIARFGLETATTWLAALVVLVAVPVAVFVLRSDPRRHGLEPDGSLEHAQADPRVSMASQVRVWGAREALRTSSFWRLALAFGLILFSQVGFMVHQLAHLRPILGPELAPFAISATAAGSIVGRLTVGFFADQLDKRLVAVGLCGFQAAMVACFSFLDGALPIFAVSFAVGFTIGNIFMFQSLLVSDLFGMPSFGKVYGAVQLVSQVLSALGPWAVGLVSVQFGYPSAYRMLVVAGVLAALVVAGLRPPPALPLQGRKV